MATYQELVSQAEALMAQAEQVRKNEIANVIAEIKATMKKHGITLKDLGGAGAARGAKAGSGVVKYRNANGETWTGGAGRRPAWVKNALAAGENLEKYRV